MRVIVFAVAMTTAAAAAALPVPIPQAAPGHSASHLSRHESTSNGDRIPPERAADSYAIYSLLMPGNLLSGTAAGNTTRWAIAAQTVNFADMDPRIDPRGALKPPPGDEKAFHQAVGDFERLQDVTFRLERRFQLDHPYDLLDAAQVRELRQAKSSAYPGSTLQTRYAVYPGVTFFSAVYFSDDQKAALVYRNDWCGVLCSQAQWIFLQKINGHWERRSGITVPGA